MSLLTDVNALGAAAQAAVEDTESKLANAYRLALRRAGKDMAQRFRERALAIVADAGMVPPDGDEVVDTQKLSNDLKKSGTAQRRKAVDEIAAAINAALDVTFDVAGLRAEDHLAAIGEKTRFAAEKDLRAAYATVLEQATQDGWDVQRTAREIQAAVGGAAEGHAATYARTELNGLANSGSVQAARQVLPDGSFKVWLATDDGRTRESHVEADGQAVPINDFFQVGGSPIRYPGDPFGPDEEVYNCRCTVIYSETLAASGGGARLPGHLPLPDAIEEAPVSTTASGGIQPKVGEALPAGETREAIEVPPGGTATLVSDEPGAPEAQPLVADADVEVSLQQRDPIPFKATLCVEGEPTEDGRMLEVGSTSWRELPLTLMGMTENPEFGGHAGAKVSGRMDEILRNGNDVDAIGELTTAFGVDELAPMIDDRTVRGVSIDLAVLDYEIRDRETGKVLTPDEELDYWLDGKPTLFVVLDGIILGATVCPMQAIANAEIAITAAADSHGLRLTIFTPFERKPLTASAQTATWTAPARSVFDTTEFPGPTPLTVSEPDESGVRRVFGHLATWDTCHTGIAGVCVKPPKSPSGYAYFHVGEVETAEGQRIGVGKVMFATKHASLSASRAQAAAHYDDNGKVGAYVRATDGEHGIWLAGVVAPITAEQEVELRANPPSGDWRSVDGRLELVAACCVPVPGFPVPRAEANLVAAADTTVVSALIASSGIIVPDQPVRTALVAAGCGCEDEMAALAELAEEGVDELADLLPAD